MKGGARADPWQGRQEGAQPPHSRCRRARSSPRGSRSRPGPGGRSLRSHSHHRSGCSPGRRRHPGRLGADGRGASDPAGLQGTGPVGAQELPCAQERPGGRAGTAAGAGPNPELWAPQPGSARHAGHTERVAGPPSLGQTGHHRVLPPAKPTGSGAGTGRLPETRAQLAHGSPNFSSSVCSPRASAASSSAPT